MGKTAKEKVWTDRQLKSKIKGVRFFISIVNTLTFKKIKKPVGKERFIPADEGNVRVLTYNMDNPQRLPLFVNMHGGGFVLGNAAMDDPFMANIAFRTNVKIISIDYSLAPEFPFPRALNECFEVIKYAKEHADEFGIDPEKIGVGGQSAGGNLSAAICLMDKESNSLGLKCLILDYPPLDLHTEASLKPLPKGSLPVFMCRLFDASYCNNKEARKNPLISPIYASIEDLRTFPPTLIISASNDSLCGEDEKFRDNLIEAGIEVAHKRFEDVHGFNLNPGPNSDESWQMIIDHLKRYLCGLS